MQPMTRDQMVAVADTIRVAWEEAATDHPAISFLFEDYAPYLTIWDGNQCKCKHGRIFENVYYVPGHRRQAQAFLCIMPGENDDEGIDVVNVHAPSGQPILIDSQRYQLIQNLLQSSSMARTNKQIGDGRFVFGGDMNTDKVCLAQILNKLRSHGILKTSNEVLFPTWGKEGDACVVGGFTTTLVRERARNYNPRHEPYGIAIRKQPQHATEQLTTMPQTQIPTAPDTKKESRATGSMAAAVATLMRERARNHDPRQEPYGIAIRKQPQHATEQLTTMTQTQIPTAPDTKKESRAIGSMAAAVAAERIPKHQQASASEDGLFLGDADLEKIVALLLWMSQEYQSNIHKDDIHHAALEALIKCADASTGSALGLLQTASVAKLSKVIDIMILHKDGSPWITMEIHRYPRISIYTDIHGYHRYP